jgi:hypothetical protein
MPQPINYIPQGGFGHSRDTLGYLSAMGPALQGIGQARDYRKGMDEIDSLEEQRMAVGGTPKTFDFATYERLGRQIGDPNLVKTKYQGFQIEQARQQAQRKQEFQSELLKANDEKWGAGEVYNLGKKYPEFYESIKKEAESMDSVGKKIMFKNLSSSIGLAMEGTDEQFIESVTDLATAYETNPRTQDKAQDMWNLVKLSQQSPSAAKAALFALSSSLDPERTEEIFSRRKSESETDDLQAKRLETLAKIGLDKDKMKQLPTGTSKKIETLTDEIGKEDIKKAEIDSIISEAGGVVDKAGYWSIKMDQLDTMLGDRGELAKLRTKFNSVINKELMDSLPPGAASESDVTIARSGFPPEGSSKEEIAKYLNAAGRIAGAKSRYKEQRIEFLSENFSEGKATKDFMVGGKQVKKGETFAGFMKRTKNDLVSKATMLKDDTPTTTPEKKAEIEAFMKGK